jgi:hypothetical protein
MDTGSLPVYRRVFVDRLSTLLGVLVPIALVSIGLILLVAAALGQDLPFPQPAADPVLAPFRWNDLPGNLA